MHLCRSTCITLGKCPRIDNASAWLNWDPGMDRRAILSGMFATVATGAQAYPSFVAPLSRALIGAGEAAPGTLCVAVRDLATGQEVMLRGFESCPMHSVVKIFIGAYVARELDAGRWQENKMVLLQHATAANGHGRIDVAAARAGSVIVSVADMLEAMLIDSDNISADALTNLAGGPEAIHSGLNLPSGIRMTLSLRDQLKPFGISKTMETYNNFLKRTNDCATPYHFMIGLARLASGRLGSAAGDVRVLDLMRRAWRGKARVPAGLGNDWLTFGRTGTGQIVAGRTTGVHNVVIARHKVTGRKVLIVAFLKDARGGLGGQEAALARVGRAVRDAFPLG
jgi:beta-lactamase class A